jgi:hypothetical protein
MLDRLIPINEVSLDRDAEIRNKKTALMYSISNVQNYYSGAHMLNAEHLATVVEG